MAFYLITKIIIFLDILKFSTIYIYNACITQTLENMYLCLVIGIAYDSKYKSDNESN